MQGAHNAQYGSTHRARFSKPSLYAILALWLPFVDFVIVLENSFDSKMKAGSFVSPGRTFLRVTIGNFFVNYSARRNSSKSDFLEDPYEKGIFKALCKAAITRIRMFSDIRDDSRDDYARRCEI